jgi:hypothetical protein
VKKSRFTEEQIAFALKQADVGTPVEEVRRTMGISDAMLYNWRKKLRPVSIEPAAAQTGSICSWLHLLRLRSLLKTRGDSAAAQGHGDDGRQW